VGNVVGEKGRLERGAQQVLDACVLVIIINVSIIVPIDRLDSPTKKREQ